MSTRSSRGLGFVLFLSIIGFLSLLFPRTLIGKDKTGIFGIIAGIIGIFPERLQPWIARLAGVCLFVFAGKLFIVLGAVGEEVQAEKAGRLHEISTQGKAEMAAAPVFPNSVGPAAVTVDPTAEIDKLMLNTRQLWDQGNHQQAVQNAKMVLDKCEQSFGPNHPKTNEIRLKYNASLQALSALGTSPAQ